MSLFTDSDHVTQSDMAALDPEIGSIVTAEGFSADVVAGIIRQSWDACADAITEAAAPRYGDYADPVIAAHTGIASGPVQLSRIVVSSEYANRQSVLERWITWRACVAFWRAVANRSVSVDRYDEKLKRAAAETDKAWRAVWSTGLDIVTSPMPCPGAVHELGSGTFGASNVESVAGGASAETDYEATITWLDPTAQNGESGPSATVTVTVELNELLRANITGLNPPGSITVPRSANSGYVSMTATHWNLYVGAVGGTKYKQNASPIAIGTTEYTLPAAPVLSGAPLWSGQVADARYRFQRVVGRG